MALLGMVQGIYSIRLICEIAEGLDQVREIGDGQVDWIGIETKSSVRSVIEEFTKIYGPPLPALLDGKSTVWQLSIKDNNNEEVESAIIKVEPKILFGPIRAVAIDEQALYRLDRKPGSNRHSTNGREPPCGQEIGGAPRWSL